MRDDGVVLGRDVHLGQVPLVVNVVQRPLTLVPGQRGGHTHFVVKVHRGRVAVVGALVAGRLLLRRLIPVRRPRFHLERGHNVVTTWSHGNWRSFEGKGRQHRLLIPSFALQPWHSGREGREKARKEKLASMSTGRPPSIPQNCL